MSDQPHPASDSLSPSRLQRMDQICDRFEDAWKTDQRPRIKDYLNDVPEPERSLLLRHLLVLDLEYRRQSGETLVVEDYLQRFPEHANLIRAIFAAELARARSKELDSSDHQASTGPEAEGGEVAQPERLGRYRITGTLGEGGFGVVYKGHDDELRREVAIKVPHRTLVSRREDAEVYLTEARTVAALDHPNIVPVYDVGSTEDCPCFIVSKFIEGSTLAKRLKEQPPSSGEAAELVATVAEALHYAHRKGLVHRDIKPGNILLDKSGKPFVADFGLALREQDIGKGPRYAGTLPYMSPEQARGEGHRVDGRSDIFSLGVVFYELLTGRRPFRGETRDELFGQITSLEVRPPRQIDDTIPQELERICVKALSKRASERYMTAKDMADDLRHFLAEQTVNAKGTGRRERASIAVRIGKIGCAVSLLASLLIVASLHLSLMRVAQLQKLESEPPIVYLPPGCKPDSGAETVVIGRRHLYKRILREREGTPPIPFILIHKTANNGSAPFYIMENKVSNRLFGAFAIAHSRVLENSLWKQGGRDKDGNDLPAKDHPDFPVFNVTLLEAHKFAEWLGGEIPTARQWDQAAGRFDDEARPGPYIGNIADLKPGKDIALQGEPMAVGTAARDVTIFGCRDMAGNGREWTRTILTQDNREHLLLDFSRLEPEQEVFLRGRSYLDSVPFQFRERADLDSERSDKPRWDIGFRVVITSPT